MLSLQHIVNPAVLKMPWYNDILNLLIIPKAVHASHGKITDGICCGCRACAICKLNAGNFCLPAAMHLLQRALHNAEAIMCNTCGQTLRRPWHATMQTSMLHAEHAQTDAAGGLFLEHTLPIKT